MKRVHEAVTARAERVLLIWLAARLPAWVTSDLLTAIGVAGAALSFVGYWQSGRSAIFLWLAVAGVVLNWFGDSLDGTLARLHKAERPKYGFYLDHMTDTFAIALIAIGIGLSPYVRLELAMAVLLGYYVLVIQSLVASHATGIFKISFNGLGPTEIRLFIIVCTLAVILFPAPHFVVMGMDLTLYDGIMLFLTGMMIVMSVSEGVRMLRALAIEDPPRR